MEMFPIYPIMNENWFCFMLVHTCVAECLKWRGGGGEILFLRMYPRWSFMYHVFTRMPGESYRRRFMSVVVSLVSRAVLIPFVC